MGRLTDAQRTEIRMRAIGIRAGLAGDKKLQARAGVQADLHEVVRKANLRAEMNRRTR
jgi:hypothetical protein